MRTTIYLVFAPAPVVVTDLRATAVLRIEKGITFVSILHKRQRFGQIKTERVRRGAEIVGTTVYLVSGPSPVVLADL